MSSFLDFWEDGTEITSKVRGPKYWKLKLHSHIQKSVARRDKKKLSKLIRASAILRDVKRETYYTSRGMMILVSGLVTSSPTDPKTERISSQFYRKLPKIDKTRVYREVLRLNALHQTDAENIPDGEKGQLVIKTSGQYALVSQANTDKSCDVSLLIANPVADVDIVNAEKALPVENWQNLVDRVDALTGDVPSWQALLNFIGRVDDGVKGEMHEFCKSYFRKYHLIQENDEEEEGGNPLNELIKAVFEALDL